MKASRLGWFGLLGLLGLLRFTPSAASGVLVADVTVRLHEVVSWVVAAISVTLLVRQWVRDPLTPIYMSLQGLLKACNRNALFYFAQSKDLQERRANESIPFDEHRLLLQGASNEFAALVETITGAMKSVKPSRDTVIDSGQYTGLGARGVAPSLPVAGGPRSDQVQE